MVLKDFLIFKVIVRSTYCFTVVTTSYYVVNYVVGRSYYSKAVSTTVLL